ncbi:MAG TPA: hypothetical protein PLQ35_02155 [bacterium]|nr:hypothetical protein [bacterium]HQL61075.1 hypothetical protein [bacterium]
MNTHKRSAFSLVASAVAVTVFFGLHGSTAATLEVPADVVLLDVQKLKGIPIFESKSAYFSWPAQNVITDRAHPTSAKEIQDYPEAKKAYPRWGTTTKVNAIDARYMAANWIKTVLRQEYLPDDLVTGIILLDGADSESDTACIRYSTDRGYDIQIIQTNGEICVLFARSGSPKGELIPAEDMSADMARSTVADTIRILFNKSEAILLVRSLAKVQDQNGTYYLHPDLRILDQSQSEASNQWWGHISWWTDGVGIAFYIPKYYGGKMIPIGLPLDWF